MSTTNAAPVYLDHNATTPVAPEVREAMLPWLGQHWGNPSSGHAHGREAAAAMRTAREQVAAGIRAEPDEVLFTGGGTESNNMVLQGVVPRDRVAGGLVIGSVEHPSVEGPAMRQAASGWGLDRIRVDDQGRIELDHARELTGGEPELISVMLAQNETGAIQPIGGLTGLVRESSPTTRVHSDAAQAVGKIPVNVSALGVDFLTIAGHKLGAPKGVGALYMRRGSELSPIYVGGGQERGLRPGTENIAFIVGLGVAVAVAVAELEESMVRRRELRERLWRRLGAGIDGLRRTIDAGPVLPNTLHVLLPLRTGAELLAACPRVSASTGSACHALEGGGVGGVLGAMGLSLDDTRRALRFSVGRETTAEMVDAASEAVVQAWCSLSGDAA